MTCPGWGTVLVVKPWTRLHLRRWGRKARCVQLGQGVHIWA